MAWPLRLRAESFAITLAVTIVEAAVYGAPLGVLAWLAGLASAERIVTVLGILGALWSLTIAVSTHLWPRTVRNGMVEAPGASERRSALGRGKELR
jgi:hypothetical protein